MEGRLYVTQPFLAHPFAVVRRRAGLRIIAEPYDSVAQQLIAFISTSRPSADGSSSFKGTRSSLLIRSLHYNCLPDGLISRNKYNFILKLIFPKDTNLRVSNGYCPTSSIPRIEFYSLSEEFLTSF